MFSLDEHIKYGKILQSIRDDLIDISHAVYSKYGCCEEAEMIFKMLADVQELRHLLNNKILVENHFKNNNEDNSIYYPTNMV